jgi:tetratricopeptide (TPR) repeat protein
MKCQHCGHENPSHAKFCLACGHRFAELQQENQADAGGNQRHENFKDFMHRVLNRDAKPAEPQQESQADAGRDQQLKNVEALAREYMSLRDKRNEPKPEALNDGDRAHQIEILLKVAKRFENLGLYSQAIVQLEQVVALAPDDPVHQLELDALRMKMKES